MPAFSTRLSLLRRRLALAFFFEDSSCLSKPSAKPVHLGLVAHRLTRPEFSIKRDTDFTELAAAISILNVGVDCGDPPIAGFNKTDDKAFNEEVDELSWRVKSMFNQIIDTGASHMKRTEAKGVLEAFHARLIYAVRTKPKPKKMLYGDSDMDHDHRQTNFMTKFLEKREGKAVAGNAELQEAVINT